MFLMAQTRVDRNPGRSIPVLTKNNTGWNLNILNVGSRFSKPGLTSWKKAGLIDLCSLLVYRNCITNVTLFVRKCLRWKLFNTFYADIVKKALCNSSILIVCNTFCKEKIWCQVGIHSTEMKSTLTIFVQKNKIKPWSHVMSQHAEAFWTAALHLEHRVRRP